MEKSVYIILRELYKYSTDPERKIFNTNDVTHLTSVLATLLAVYEPETAQHAPSEPQEARRALQTSHKKHWWEYFTT
jgi:hypothetical protein